jgi:hypothetical protein
MTNERPTPRDAVEGQMSGHMVTRCEGDQRNFYMVNDKDPDWCCAEVNRLFPGKDGAPVSTHATTPLSDSTLDQFKCDPRKVRLCMTMHAHDGKVLSSYFGQEMAF